MGYRSEIGAVLSVDMWMMEPETKENKDFAISKYKEMIGLIKLSRFYELMNQSTEDRTCIGWKAGEFFFHVQDWKWYPDYEIVQAWDELWEQMQNTKGISGYFCRVGEEADDISEDNFGDEPDFDAFQPYSSLSVDVAKETFGNGDIDNEIPNIVSKEERELLCMDNQEIQA